jgi:hypothetical protein
MNCPKCEIPMEMGVAEIHETLLGLLAVGRSFQPLFFTDMKGKESQILLPNSIQVAYRCNECSGTFITKEK